MEESSRPLDSARGDKCDMTIVTVNQVSHDVIKIASDEGLVFFVKTYFLEIVKASDIVEGAVFGEDEANDILDASLCFLSEKKATEYLSRAEQSRFRLEMKLQKKGFQKPHIKKALDYIEKNNFLSDERFALSWLQARKINHAEGRSKLLAELLRRGISKTTSKMALDKFFNENDEKELCLRAIEKYKNQGKTDEKLIQSLLNAGFQYKMIREVIKDM